VLSWRTKKPLGPFHEIQVNLESIYERSWDGANLRRFILLGAFGQLRNFWHLYAELNYDFSRVDIREARDGTWTERAGGVGSWLWLKSDPSRRVIMELDGGVWQVQHGVGMEGRATLSLRIIPALELDVIPHGAWTVGDPRWFDTVANADRTRTYYFALLNSRALDVTLRGTYTFSPRLTLQLYTQLFVAAGHYGRTYAQSVSSVADHALLSLQGFAGAAMPPDVTPDFRSGTINVNLVLRWEYRPGAVLTAVYTHSHAQVPYDATREPTGQLDVTRFQAGPETDLFLLKLSALIGS
jgi:hypothetical protein